MRSLRVAAVALATAVVFSATASAAADEMLRPHHLKKKAAHWNANAMPGQPGPANALGSGYVVVSDMNTGLWVFRAR